MKRSMLNYSVHFRTLRDNKNKVIGRLNSFEILTDDLGFINLVKNSKADVTLPQNKIKYIIVNKMNGERIAAVDKKLNIFTFGGEYLGSLHNMSFFHMLIGHYMILTLITLLLVMLTIPTITLKYKDIYVRDDEAILTEEWNIFGKEQDKKIVYPGQIGSYRFRIINENRRKMVCDIDFSDINDYNLPIVYRLSTTGKYLCGNSNEWVKIDELNVKELELPRRGECYLTIEWKWQDDGDRDEIDTILGNKELVPYTINIKMITRINKR